MRTTKFSQLVFLIALSFFLASFPLVTQAENQPPDKTRSKTREDKQTARREKMQRKINSIRLVKLIEELELNEEKALKVNKIMKEVQAQQLKLTEEKDRLYKDLRKHTKQDSIDTKSLQKNINQLVALENNLANLPTKEFKRVETHLTPKEKAQFLMFRHDFNREIRRLLHKHHRGRGRGPSSRNGNSEDRRSKRRNPKSDRSED